MTKLSRLTAFAAAVALISALSFFTGSGIAFLLHPGSPLVTDDERPPTSLQETFGVFWEAWKIVEEEYYRQPVDPLDLTYGALSGSLETLDDPNTFFVPPSHRFILDDLEGSFEGIGAVVDLNDEGYLVIVEPLEGRPADLAGLHAGDVVLAVDGTSVQGMDLWEIIALIRGPEGTPVQLTIHRERVAEPFEVEITRQRIEIETVEYRMLDEGIAYLQLTEFNAIAADKVRAALIDLMAQNPQGLILDLRDNPGGFVSSVEAIGEEFLPAGLLFYETSKDGERQDHIVSGTGLATEIPLVVLINAGSASASEILAGAVQDQSRGILIGQPSFGKGSVQIEHTLSDGSGLRVTTAHWFTPDGRGIDDQGLTPDVIVEFTPADEEAGLDPQLDAAVEYLLQETSSTALLPLFVEA
ncbi:MAG: S41 family peptidase [Chloroflexi bacterium]|nr:S41 family peptidase [Chloroflexota bacterium]